MTEADLQQAIVETARLVGYRVAHFRAAQTKHGWRTPVAADGKGFPDLVLVRADRLLFCELKSGKGKLSPEQAQWLEGLRKVADACPTVEVHVWSPADWPDRVMEVLTGRRVRSRPVSTYSPRDPQGTLPVGGGAP